MNIKPFQDIRPSLHMNPTRHAAHSVEHVRDSFSETITVFLLLADGQKTFVRRMFVVTHCLMCLQKFLLHEMLPADTKGGGKLVILRG